MALTIISESYGARKPLVVCEADSMEDLAGLVCAEGSEATVGETTYVLDRVNGWIEPGSGPSGGGALLVNGTYDEQSDTTVLDKTAAEIWAAAQSGIVLVKEVNDVETVISPLLSAYSSENGSYNFETRRDGYDAATGTDYPVAGGSN